MIQLKKFDYKLSFASSHLNYFSNFSSFFLYFQWLQILIRHKKLFLTTNCYTYIWERSREITKKIYIINKQSSNWSKMREKKSPSGPGLFGYKEIVKTWPDIRIKFRSGIMIISIREITWYHRNNVCEIFNSDTLDKREKKT